jgi:hypothetical protein
MNLEELPNEILSEILSFLDPKEVETSSTVSKRWSMLTNDVTLWKRLCTKRKPTTVDQLVALPDKDHFFNQLELRLFKVRSFNSSIERYLVSLPLLIVTALKWI